MDAPPAPHIREKIAKLLALAGNNSSASEARAALLKARALMAAYKVQNNNINISQPVRKEDLGLHSTTSTDNWLPALSEMIAKRYCCIAYWHSCPEPDNTRCTDITLAGLESDFQVCREIIYYAVSCVRRVCEDMGGRLRRRGFDEPYIRKLCNAYGWGFADGLRTAYAAQSHAHQEWALVMVVPPPVTAAVGPLIETPYGYHDTEGACAGYYDAGRTDGAAFQPERTLCEL